MILHSIHIPDSCQDITVGSVVIIRRFPETKWVLQDGWYIYEGQRYNGWYFSSIPAQTTIPVMGTDLFGITVISNGSCDPNPHHPGCCPGGSTANISQPSPVEMYLEGVNYIKGQLVWLDVGAIYQVTEDFRSSADAESTENNMQVDIENGHLQPILPEWVCVQ